MYVSSPLQSISIRIENRTKIESRQFIIFFYWFILRNAYPWQCSKCIQMASNGNWPQRSPRHMCRRLCYDCSVMWEQEMRFCVSRRQCWGCFYNLFCSFVFIFSFSIRNKYVFKVNISMPLKSMPLKRIINSEIPSVGRNWNHMIFFVCKVTRATSTLIFSMWTWKLIKFYSCFWSWLSRKSSLDSILLCTFYEC